jgi:hypothetical protein
MIQLALLENLQLNIKTEENTRKVWDIVRKKWIVLTPEEYVRQALLHYFTNTMQYPVGLIAVEKQVKYGSLIKRYDIVVHNRKQQPWLLVECKAPEIAISHSTLQQLLQYHSQIPCPYWLLSNGIESHCARVQGENIEWLRHLPEYE